MQDLESVFRRFFFDNVWGSKESVSGPGSTAWSTEEIRRQLPSLFRELDVQSLLDAGCGDFNWMRDVELELDYLGCDIVPELIKQNRQRYQNCSRRFVCLDIVNDRLPKVDLVLCRDCLGHLPFDLIRAALLNFRDSNSEYLLATSFPEWPTNNDIILVGGWRPLNLERDPFNFPQPLRLIRELNVGDASYTNKSLGLWLFADIGTKWISYHDL
jgi:SAM-dependent methyltransferase